MKKEEILNQFIKFTGVYRTSFEYRNSAKRVLKYFDCEQGTYVNDIVYDDFEGTEIDYKRRRQIADRAGQGAILSASMIVDFLIHVGGKILKQLDENNAKERKNRDEGIILKSVSMVVTRECYDLLTKESEKRNVPISSLLEQSVNYYCDKDDSEK